MKAVIWSRYGPPELLRIEEVDRPEPKPDEILVRVKAANVFAGDCELRRFALNALFWLPLRLMIGITRPRPRFRILGQELAGEVVAVGARISNFKPGDSVFSPLGMGGAHAEYVSFKPVCAVTKPDNVSFEEAAVVSVGGLNALHFLRLAGLGPGSPPGRKLLLNGAAGSIGTIALQLARLYGAEVTAVDSGHKLDKLRELGADRVIDYTREDFFAEK